MKLEKIVAVAIALIVTQSAYAQYTTDAFRFSQFDNSVTARFGGIGGTKAAVGGDLSAVYGNPAGVGMFTRSEFSLTPEIRLNNNKVDAFGVNTTGSSNYLDLGNVGAVFHSRTFKSSDTKSGLISLNFGIGYQKRAAYKDGFSFSGLTNSNGLGDFFADQANNDFNLKARVNKAAFDSYLIDYDEITDSDYFPITSTNSDQDYNIKRTGGSSEVSFSLGTNFSNKLFIGAAVGLTSFRYSSIENINEVGVYQDPNSPAKPDYDVDYTRYFDTEGAGVNLKIGFILKPTKELRVGLNLESPTWFNVSDNYSETLYNHIVAVDGTDSYPFDYNLNTPLKLNGGLAYFIGDRGFISADIGFVDYSNIKFSSTDNAIDSKTTKEIRRDYKDVVNYSVGGELKLDKGFSVRAGFQSMGNPYQKLANKDYTVNSFSGGLGYRFGDYYMDAALINSNSNLNYSNYFLSDASQPQAAIEKRNNRVALTFGVRF